MLIEPGGARDVFEAKRVIDVEIRAIQLLRDRLSKPEEADRFAKAVDLLVTCRGKVVVAGMGKSGLIGRKISATLSSTGTPSVFLHPAEGSHGDLGVIGAEDLVLAISYGGETPELEPLIRHSSRKGLPLIALTGRQESTLSRASTVFLSIAINEEACPMGLAPTASTTSTLVLGDALAVSALVRRGFNELDFAEFHPGGSLGRRLLTRVRDVMHSGEAMPLVGLETEMRSVLSVMTQKEVRGVAGVLDEQGLLVGIITDGDVRRRLEKAVNPLDEKAKDLMSRSPKTVDADELAEKALFMMEQFQIQTLFVIESKSDTPRRPVGLLHLQDLLKARLR